MKVMLVNGSARKHGCTGTALEQIAMTLRAQGIETETVWVGNAPLSDCIACGRCRELGQCVIDDLVNEVAEKAESCDGFVFGTPVYYAHPSGRLLTFMDRLFYSGKNHFAFKPAAAIASARRAGTVCSMDVVNKYFSISSMPIVSANYWNEVHGSKPEDVLKDEEGIMTMTNIGKNMAWMLKSIDAGKKAGIERPTNDKVFTNFIR